ncbi:hypothetical protein [Arthrobacter sp. ZGTC212]|uniref:hypothetical protein n=1 Tax=Arthrobacter sp. ZGTC212 TaxID=2058899 RepID=UPI0015E1EAEA|nr:hypothetical protein [Arthrobacter sp. ZGTC212]
MDNSVDQMLNEYRARLHWDRREYKAALGHATAAADEALTKKDITGYWRMTLLLAECQMELGLIQEFAASTKKLSESSALQGDQAMIARARALYSRALESLGHIGESLVVAQEAAAIDLPDAMDPDEELEMLHGLVAALTESGKATEAWGHALRMANLAGQHDEQVIAGKAYWAVGNVAFLNGDGENGIRFHKLAAENLAPDNDVNIWAFFNKASALARLSAGIADQETLECIERAELASSVTGGTPLMELELSTARAQWLVFNNGAEEAAVIVQQILDQRELLPEHEIAEVEYVAALALHHLGRNDEALAAAVHSEKVFIARGAHRRALEVRSIIDSINAGSH